MERTSSPLLDPNVSETLEDDKQHLWHPFTQAQTAPAPRPIVKAQGAKLYGEDGSVYIDAISSWWVTLYGHGHPYIADCIAQQAKTLEHVIFADFTHTPATKLAKRLLHVLPGELSRVFFSDNGSTAVETALKIAFQYWHQRPTPKPRNKIVVLEGGYHGETIGAMSCSDRGLFSEPFTSLMFDVVTIPAPIPGQEKLALHALQAAIAQEDVACFIFEPLVQAVSGMRFHEAHALDALLEICHANAVITIADEVMTGFGRLGSRFACDRLDNPPDIICLAKSLTAGFLPMGATACREKIFEQFLSDDRRKALLHGHSYCGNPLGCVAALANLELLDSEACIRQRQSIEEQHRAFQQTALAHPKVKDCRVRGTLLAMEYAAESDSYFSGIRDQLSQFFLDRGIVIRPFGNSIHVLPPYCISEAELEEVYRAISDSLEMIR